MSGWNLPPGCTTADIDRAAGADKTWDRYDAKIASHYPSALINGDYSGLTTEEQAQFDAWQRRMEQTARDAGWTVGHWTSDHEDGDDWGICAVTGLLAMRAEVTLMVYKEN